MMHNMTTMSSSTKLRLSSGGHLQRSPTLPEVPAPEAMASGDSFGSVSRLVPAFKGRRASQVLLTPSIPADVSSSLAPSRRPSVVSDLHAA